jgi:signal peptidase II
LFVLGLLVAGAVGNVVDRLRSAQGVVDFIEVGIGSYRWPTFNVADSAITVGAIALAVSLWLEGRAHGEGRAKEAGTAAP